MNMSSHCALFNRPSIDHPAKGKLKAYSQY